MGGSRQKEPCGVWGRALPGEEETPGVPGRLELAPGGVRDGGGKVGDKDGGKSGHGALGGLVGT